MVGDEEGVHRDSANDLPRQGKRDAWVNELVCPAQGEFEKKPIRDPNELGLKNSITFFFLLSRRDESVHPAVIGQGSSRISCIRATSTKQT